VAAILTKSELPDRVRERIEQVLDLLARISFGHLDVTVPVLPEDDEFADLFTGLEVLVADLSEAREELEEEVRRRTEALEEDIRQREQVEAQLRASEATYRMLVETSPDPIALCDRDGRVQMVNPALLSAFRLGSAEDILGASWLDFVVPDDRVRAADYARSVQAHRRICTSEITFRRRDGSEFVGEARCSVMHGAAGDGAGVQYVVHDITERRRREHEQLRAVQIEALGTLAGGIAHDFNNTLAAIAGCVSLAMKTMQPQPEARDLLSQAVDAAFRATALTRQLLTFSAGGKPVKVCLDIGELVRRVAGFCVRGSNVRCRVEVPSGPWPVEVDAGQIEQVIGNLVINAKQSMPDGGTVTVRVSNHLAAHPEAPERKRRYVCIAVEDTGMGIPAENLHRIFDPYFSTKHGGSGLGLATAYSVVRKHEGFIECASTVGHGSRFSTYLPASDHAVYFPDSDAPEPDRGQGSILVMDDDDIVRDVAAQLLGEAGYDVVAVESGSAAIAAYEDALDQRRPFSAVLLDLTVPGGDGGKETMQKLLALDPSVKGIVVSGYSDDPVIADYRRYGFVARLAKPYRLQQLLGAVKSAIEGA